MDHQFTRRQLTITVAALAAAPGIAFFAAPAGIAQDASPEASPEASPGATPGATPSAGNEVTITSYDIYFDPNEVTIPADTEVTIVLPNEGVTLHDFVISDRKNENLPFPPIDVPINPGETQETTINAPAGSYYFYCSVPGHEAAGMFGTLTAE